MLSRAGLADGDTELEQFAVDAWSSPKRVLAAHFADQVPTTHSGRQRLRRVFDKGDSSCGIVCALGWGKTDGVHPRCSKSLDPVSCNKQTRSRPRSRLFSTAALLRRSRCAGRRLGRAGVPAPCGGQGANCVRSFFGFAILPVRECPRLAECQPMGECRGQIRRGHSHTSTRSDRSGKSNRLSGCRYSASPDECRRRS
jgi:hypothetical protein